MICNIAQLGPVRYCVLLLRAHRVLKDNFIQKTKHLVINQPQKIVHLLISSVSMGEQISFKPEKGNFLMKKITLASLLVTALSTTILTAPVSAAQIAPDAEAIIAQAIAKGTSIEDAIAANPDIAESIIAAAIAAVGADSPMISSILAAAVNAGVDPDSVTAIAIASGVDATVASDATGAGPIASNNSNNANANGLQANSSNANRNSGALNNNAGGGGGSGGGGGGGISGGQ